jgi:hypothetical protein
MLDLKYKSCIHPATIAVKSVYHEIGQTTIYYLIKTYNNIYLIIILYITFIISKITLLFNNLAGQTTQLIMKE